MTTQKNLDVRRYKSSLVATFAKANPPLIWRFDLERNHSFTLGLQGDEQEWELGVTSPKGEFNPVARFPSREDAEEAFSAISEALAKNRGGWGTTCLKIIGVVAIAYVLFTIVAGVQRQASPLVDSSEEEEQGSLTPPAPSPPPPPPAPPPPPNGVPLPADQVLKPPSP